MLVRKNSLLVFMVIALLFMNYGGTVQAAEVQVQSSCDCILEEVHTSGNGNKVIRVSRDGQTHLAVISQEITVNDLTGVSKLKVKSKDLDEKIIGKRMYFQYANDISEAIQIADRTVETNSVVSPEGSYFFKNGSYVETWWSVANGFGYHVRLSSADASYIMTSAASISAAIASTIAGFSEITKPVASVLGAATGVAVGTLYWQIRNGDGSIDLWSPNHDQYDSSCIGNGQYLGSFRMLGTWFNLWYQQSWKTYCLQ